MGTRESEGAKVILKVIPVLMEPSEGGLLE